MEEINYLHHLSVGKLQKLQINGLVQERRNSIANALELCLSCINPIEI